ncbi:MAG: IclR family transcriptional regulator [Planctomycetota bacterium]
MTSGSLVQSVQRAMDILEAVARAQNGRGIELQELVRKVGLKKTTAYNLARTLVARDYLQQDDRSRYRLGPAVTELARFYHDQSVEQRAREPMQNLSTKFPNAKIVLGELVGKDIRVQLRISPDRPHVLQRPVDQTFSPYANAIGLLYMASVPPETRELLESRAPFDEFAAHLWGTRDKFNAYLEKVRQQNYAVVPFRQDETLRIACPVRNNNTMVAALGVSLPAGQATEEKVHEALQAAVNRVF